MLNRAAIVPILWFTFILRSDAISGMPETLCKSSAHAWKKRRSSNPEAPSPRSPRFGSPLVLSLVGLRVHLLEGDGFEPSVSRRKCAMQAAQLKDIVV
jgi:hypothetical protein